jgi:hypothetical protein
VILIVGLTLSQLLLLTPSATITYGQAATNSSAVHSSIGAGVGVAISSAAITAGAKPEAAYAAAGAAAAAAAEGGSIADIAKAAASSIITHGGNNAEAAAAASAAAAAAAGATRQAAAAAALAAAAGKSPSDIASAAGGGVAGTAAANAAVKAAAMSSGGKPTAVNMPQNTLKQQNLANISGAGHPIISSIKPTVAPPRSLYTPMQSPTSMPSTSLPPPFPSSILSSNRTVSSAQKQVASLPLLEGQQPLRSQTTTGQQGGQPPSSSSSSVRGPMFPLQQHQPLSSPPQPTSKIQPSITTPTNRLAANGIINSLIITPSTKWIATGDWILASQNGNIDSFNANMTWYNNNGTRTHTHELLNLRPSGGSQGIVTTEEDNVLIKGLMDVGTNHRISWTNVHGIIDIRGGKTITISLDDKETNRHFAGQAIYGIVKSFTQCSDEPGPNMEVLPPCTSS